jgi:hypothetical protein
LTSHTSPFGSKILADKWCKPELPNPYRFVANFKASLKKKFCNVTESKLVSQSPENSE